mgnify:CR=1 FL=1
MCFEFLNFAIIFFGISDLVRINLIRVRVVSMCKHELMAWTRVRNAKLDEAVGRV